MEKVSFQLIVKWSFEEWERQRGGTITLTFETISMMLVRLVSDRTQLRECFALRPPVSRQPNSLEVCFVFFIGMWPISEWKKKLFGEIYDPLTFDRRYSGAPLPDILPVDDDEVRRLLASTPAKSSPMNKVSTSILKSCDAVFRTIIAHLANLSFVRVYCVRWHASRHHSRNQVTPARTMQLQTNNMSNLNTITKVLERLFFCAAAPTHLFVSELQLSSIRLPTGSFNANGAIKIPKWRLPILRFEKRHTSGSAWYIGCVWYARHSYYGASTLTLFWCNRRNTDMD